MIKDKRGRFSKKAISMGGNMMSTVQYFGNNKPVINSLQNDIALIQAFNETPEVYGVISYMVGAISKVKYKLYSGTKDDLGDRIKKHDILNLMNMPNKIQSWYEFIKHYYAYYYVNGNSYMNAFTPAGLSKPNQMFVFPSQYMQIVPVQMDDGEATYSGDFRLNAVDKYKFSYNNNTINVDSKNILHKRNLNLEFADGKFLFGMSPILSSKFPINSLLANYEAKIAIIQNKGAMGILSSENAEMPITKAQKEEVYTDYYNKFGLSSNQHQLLITSSPLKYQQMVMPIKDLQLNENNMADYRSVCRSLNFPSYILGDTAGSTYSNMKEAVSWLWEDNLIPQVDDFFSDFSNFITKFWGENLVVVPDYSNVSAIQKDLVVLNNVLKSQMERGVITPNEWRKKAGMDESTDPNMNKHYISKGFIPMGTNED